ncbi:MAG TPA: glycosyltransferase [Thermogutta sp.]|nr:glycosyltransferase [Thermogutta sp.]
MIEFAIALACAGCLAAVETFLVGVQAWEHRRFAASRLRSSPKAQMQAAGRAMVIIPCRGIEPNLKGNLERFFRQDYSNYGLRFVVESHDDPAAEVIQQLIEEYPNVPAELVTAGLANGEAQKIHNLRVATEKIPPEVEYLVFADSDAAPSEHWLTAMLMRLGDPKVSAVTGYRWFIPKTGAFHEAVVCALNGAYAMLMSRNTPNLVWGGSWAIRKEVFEELDIRGAWRGRICDDLVAADRLLKCGRHVEYEPACLVATSCQPDLKAVFEFASRQFFLLRRVLPLWWFTDLVVGYLGTVVFWLAIVTLIMVPDTLVRWTSAIVAAVSYALHWARAELRVAAVRTYFPRLAGEASFRRVFWYDRVLSPAIQLIGLLASLNGGLRRQIIWRGIIYRMGKKAQIEIVRPSNGSSAYSEINGGGPSAAAAPILGGPEDTKCQEAPEMRRPEKKVHPVAA